MEFQDIINIAIGASIPLLIFYLGYLIKRRQDKIEGKHRNRIQFEIEANYFGPQNGHYIVEVIMALTNKGLVSKKLNELTLTIRGIEANTNIGLFLNLGDLISIANFPEEIVKTNVLEKKVKSDEKKKDKLKKIKEKEWLVEPGVVQKFSYVARLPEAIRFILAQSGFK